MPNRIRSWLVRLAVAGGLLFPIWTGACQAGAQQPQSTVIDLKFTQQKEDPSSWYGFMPNKDGKIQHRFSTGKGQLILELIDDKLRVDTNGDGAIDDKDAPAWQVISDRETFRIQVPVKVAGKIADYPLCVRVQKSGDQRWLLVGSAAVLEGTYGQHAIRIFDGNLDGRFGAPGDRILIAASGDNTPFRYGVPWSRTAAFGQQLQQLEMLGEGAQLKLTPYTGPVAEVAVEFSTPVQNAQATFQEVTGLQIGQCSTDLPGLFVPGKYRIYNLSFDFKSGDTLHNVYGSHDPDKSAIELKPGRNLIKVGPPFKMDFAANRNGNTLEFTQVSIAGQAGETYRPYVDEDRGDSFAAYIRAGGKEQKLASLSFG